MTTKERILHETLVLLSHNGYEAVSMRDIGAAVGIRESSIYKHYSSKQAIFDAIVEKAMEEINQMFIELDVPDTDSISSVSRYANMNLEDVAELCSRMLLKQNENETVSKFRQILTIEQYRNKSLRMIYTDVFMERQLSYIEKVFEYLLHEAVLQGKSAKMMALQFYAPFFLLQYKLQGDEEKMGIEIKTYIISFLEEHLKGEE